jgi:hypothetical protein
VPESNAPRLIGRSWTLRADLSAAHGEPPRGVIASIGGRSAGMALHVDRTGRPVFTMRVFDVASLELRGEEPLGAGTHQLLVELDYDGGGRGRGASIRLSRDGDEVAAGRVAVTPPAIFSIDETFDIGASTGSSVGDYLPPHAFTGGRLDRVVIDLA